MQDAVQPDLLADSKVVASDALNLNGQFFLHGEVTDTSCDKLGQDLLRFAYAHRNDRDKPPIVLRIHTNGGDVYATWLLCSVLMEVQAMGYQVITHATKALSAGAIILQFGTTRQMDVRALLLLHDVQANIAVGTARRRQTREDVLQGMRNQIAEVFAARTTNEDLRDSEFWLKHYLDEDVYMDAREALDLGVIDRIVGDAPRPPRPT